MTSSKAAGRLWKTSLASLASRDEQERAGYDYVPYTSLESVIEENKYLYYKALRRTQTTLKGDEPDWEPWVGFFLCCLKKQKNNLAQRLDRDQIASGADAELPEISLKILALLRSHGRQKIMQITEATGANRNTIKLRLRELVNGGKIRRHGKASPHGTPYEQ